MDEPTPYIDPEADDPARPVCGICPSKRLPREQFVIYDRPSRECPFDPEDGFRYAAERIPACVHPHKIGLEPDRIAPAAVPEALSELAEAMPSPRKRWSWSFRGR